MSSAYPQSRGAANVSGHTHAAASRLIIESVVGVRAYVRRGWMLHLAGSFALIIRADYYAIGVFDRVDFVGIWVIRKKYFSFT